MATLYTLQREKDLAGDKNETRHGNNVVSLFDHSLETEFEIARKRDVSDELDEEQRTKAITQAEQDAILVEPEIDDILLLRVARDYRRDLDKAVEILVRGHNDTGGW